MSHIPANAMPRTKANDDTTDGQPVQSESKPPAPDPAPLSSKAPATATGNREGSTADRTAREAGQPQTGAQTPVDGTVSAQDRPSPEQHRERRSGPRSKTGVAALAVGGLAVIGGIAAALYPKLRIKEEPKSKKRKRKKA